MLVSYNWLRAYFQKSLPMVEELAEILTFLAFEVEGITYTSNEGDDDENAIFDVKVLPDRACYALSHRGIAYEVAAITGFPRITYSPPQPVIKKVKALDVRVETPEFCSRYIARVVENITPSPKVWVKAYLKAISQRFINPIVDGANITMFDMGQPLHVFDADKVEGGLVVRLARTGEKIVTLDNREIVLDKRVLVIADSKAPLAIAGIKGGKKAEVTASTKNLILESANFNALYIRETSERLGIRTDASKRFENRLSPELAITGMNDFTAHLFEMDKNISAGEIFDWYPKPLPVHKITVSAKEISKILGIDLSTTEISELVSRFEIIHSQSGDNLILTIPSFRLDLTIPEDIAEEVGRLVGYDKIPATLPAKGKVALTVPKQFYWEWKIREFLVSEGFSEVMTSSFAEQGEVEIEHPLAEDKSFLREHLSKSMEMTLKLNLVNLPLLGIQRVKVFEIGKVFVKEGEPAAAKALSGEHTSLCIGIAQPKGFRGGKVNDEIRVVRDKLIAALGVSIQTACTIDDTGGIILLFGKPIGEINRVDGILELNLDSLIAVLRDPNKWDVSIERTRGATYALISQFPFIVRDIAFFISSDVVPEDAHCVIEKEAGSLARRVSMFDQFEKNGKMSLAFRIVFQADDRTLTDEEANKIMEKISSALAKKFNAEVR